LNQGLSSREEVRVGVVLQLLEGAQLIGYSPIGIGTQLHIEDKTGAKSLSQLSNEAGSIEKFMKTSNLIRK
jgi:hypothetical protein